MCNGKCYRLYTAQFFEREMSETTVPEIQRTNMLTAVLYLKSLPLDIDVLAFDYLDSPGVRHISRSCTLHFLQPDLQREKRNGPLCSHLYWSVWPVLRQANFVLAVRSVGGCAAAAAHSGRPRQGRPHHRAGQAHGCSAP